MCVQHADARDPNVMVHMDAAASDAKFKFKFIDFDWYVVLV